MRRFLFGAIVGSLMFSIAHAQDTQSLGDIARQVRQQKQQKEAQGKKPAKTLSSAASSHDSDSDSRIGVTEANSHVVTNDQESDHASADASPTGSTSANSKSLSNQSDNQSQGEQWKSQIQEQKSAIAALQHEIDELASSIQYAGANCVANCVQWNEHQQQKQQQLDTMKAQLEEQQHHLEEMQDAARKQGFGSAIYDP
ncbi:MAG TPA: hypothetical protein VGS27_21165 [Candidatus Sulfotelmatobacter sp.]|nr:hypothetical protein [Candidatus Sulfotelmatobacter sp.]